MISTDSKQIEELLSRGVENVYPKRDFLSARLKEGKQLTLYTGYDPTGTSLHIGHGITMVKLRQFQDLGHKIVMLIGDFTGMIGDPTDKGAARKTLTHDECVANAKEYMKQASAILNFEGENPVEVKYNGEWLGKLMTADWLDITAQFTVQQMMERDMFQKRLEEEKPIFVHEFLYPLMQGFDSVAMNVDGEVGGNDQTFNMLTGRDMMKNESIMSKYGADKKTKEKFVLTTKLLADDSGKKMSKSEGNAIFLSDSPEDMFGKVMRFSDGMIVNAFELATRVSISEIDTVKKELDGGANPRDAKLRLAYEITKTFLGEAAAEQGREHFKSVIQDREMPGVHAMSTIKPSTYDIVTILVESGACTSRSNARRDIQGGGVEAYVVDGKFTDTRVTNPEMIIEPGMIVKKGKRFFVRVV
jgi:tyrosyl-tRNA synthetase